MPPGSNMDDWYTILTSGMWRLRYKLSPEGRTRFFQEFLPLLHDTKFSVLGARDDDSYYLVYVGTRSGARGQGLAKKCIGLVTKKADEEGRVCYLESSNEMNPIIYRKLGFEIVKKVNLIRAEEEVGLDIMVREPIGGGFPEKGDQIEKGEAKTVATLPKMKLQIRTGHGKASGEKTGRVTMLKMFSTMGFMGNVVGRFFA